MNRAATYVCGFVVSLVVILLVATSSCIVAYLAGEPKHVIVIRTISALLWATFVIMAVCAIAALLMLRAVLEGIVKPTSIQLSHPV